MDFGSGMDKNLLTLPVGIMYLLVHFVFHVRIGLEGLFSINNGFLRSTTDWKSISNHSPLRLVVESHNLEEEKTNKQTDRPTVRLL